MACTYAIAIGNLGRSKREHLVGEHRLSIESARLPWQREVEKEMLNKRRLEHFCFPQPHRIFFLSGKETF